jgi:acyl-CoA thioester hydrolase
MQKLLQSFYTIRFPDCDPFGHLNNSRYIDYMLNAREDHLKEFYQMSLDQFYKEGLGWMVNSHQIIFIRPAIYNERCAVQSCLIDAGESHLLVEMTLWDEAITTCKAILWTKFVHVNLKTGRKEKHSAAFSDFVKTVLVDEVDLEGGPQKRPLVLSGFPPKAESRT